MDAEAAAESPIFGERVAHGYLAGVRGGPVRRPRPRAGAGELRPGRPALPHPGAVRRRDHRDADRASRSRPRQPRRLRRGALGRRRHAARTASPWPRTTCSPWWPGRRSSESSLRANHRHSSPREAPSGGDAMSARFGEARRRPRRSTPRSGCRSTSCGRCSSTRLRGTLRHAYDERAALPPGVRRGRACTPTTAATSRTWPGSPPPPRPTCGRTTRSACSPCRRSEVRAHPRLVRHHRPPTVVGYTEDDLAIWAELMARSLRAAGGRPGAQGAQRLRLRPVHRRAGRALRRRAAGLHGHPDLRRHDRRARSS